MHPFHWRKVKLPGQARVLKNPLARTRPIAVRPAEKLAAVFCAAPRATPYERSKPNLIDAPSCISRYMNWVFESGPAQPPPAGLAVFKDASILAGGVVATSNGTIVAESLANTELEREFGPLTRSHDGALPDITVRFGARQRRLSGQPHVLLKQTFDQNYGHWLIECLPRLAAVASQFDLEQCRFIVSDWGDMRGVYLDSLQAFGIRPAQVVELGFEVAHVDQLIYPLPFATHPWVKSPAIIEALKPVQTYYASRQRPPALIYASRNRFGTRRLLNEREILRVCSQYGFEVVYPEQMSFGEQVRAFSGAKVVVGNLGAALTNMVFAPCGSTVLALASPHMHDGFFWDLAALKDQRYVSLHGQLPGDIGRMDDSRDLDFTIEPERFAAVLADVMTARPSAT